MSEHSKHTTNKLIESLDLPKDIFLGLPVLSMMGNRELYLSNHRGILSYGQEEMTLLVKDFQIQVKGKELTIVSYTKEDLTIQGYISSVDFL